MHKNAITIRYAGTDENRCFVLQRGDHKFWNGGGWDQRPEVAFEFGTHKAAQTACAALQYARHRGKPVRTFKVELSIVLAADDVDAIPQSSLATWLANALRLDIENVENGDGPVADSFVQARIKLNTLTETQGRRRTF